MERGKKVIEGIFMIGETLQGKVKTKGRRRGRRKARGGRPGVMGKRGAKARRIERIAMMKEKGITNTEIARKVGVSLVTVAKDLKEAKKEK